MRKINISVMVSGGGTNFQAIIDAIQRGDIPQGQIVQVISSSSKAYALTRAENHNIKAKVIGGENYPDQKRRTDAILQALAEEETELIVLAGYMSILDERLIAAYRNRIINIHPSLIPKYCGKGFYGRRVHEAVLAGGERESGATVHFVDEGVDTGQIILQRRVPVEPQDTPDSLAARVLEVEHTILPLAVKQLTEALAKK